MRELSEIIAEDVPPKSNETTTKRHSSETCEFEMSVVEVGRRSSGCSCNKKVTKIDDVKAIGKMVKGLAKNRRITH